MNTLTYKGYTARIDFDDRDNSLVGKLLGIQDIICFHADNVADLHAAFEEAVDDYLEACEKIGKLPEIQPAASYCSGFRQNFMLRPWLRLSPSAKALTNGLLKL
jgi:predicted HicB family RNase H-like nuclease